MEVTTELCRQIEDMASKFVPPSQMAALLNINEDELKMYLQNHTSELRKSFLRGMATTANTLREDNIRLAKAGVPDAIHSCFSAMRDMFIDLSE